MHTGYIGRKHIDERSIRQQREDYSSGCSSGRFALGRWLLASLFALFAAINRCLRPSVSRRDVVLVIGMMAMGSIFSPVSARDFICNATIDLQGISASYTPPEWASSCSGLFCNREAKCKEEIKSKC